MPWNRRWDRQGRELGRLRISFRSEGWIIAAVDDGISTGSVSVINGDFGSDAVVLTLRHQGWRHLGDTSELKCLISLQRRIHPLFSI
jgi:hypothetical protein